MGMNQKRKPQGRLMPMGLVLAPVEALVKPQHAGMRFVTCRRLS